MTTKGQPGRVVRIDDETWDAYGQLCAEKGIARAADMRMHVVREVNAWRKANGIEPPAPKKRTVKVPKGTLDRARGTDSD
ncbi:hypothetical protein ACIQH0_37805 [Streptomyces griseus]|uniref:hypothetical protein n=1 Tax=Streptomyces griseus TaxID=1911 RepID=UPI003812FBBB